MKGKRVWIGVILCVGLVILISRLRIPPERETVMALKIVRINKATFNIIVPVVINGHGPFPFLLDTGAPGIVMATDIAYKTGIRLEKTKDSVVGVGTKQSCSYGTATSLAVGSARVEGLSVVATDFSSYRTQTGNAYDGILGLAFMQHFQVTLDFPGGVLRLSQRGSR